MSQATKETSIGKRRRVLIIDDSEDAALSLTMLLKIDGHEVQTAHDGASGMELMLQLPAEIILLDIGLPGINGYELAKQIRQHSEGSSALLIALIGWGQKQDKLDAAAAGFDLHLTKPVDYPKLLAILNRPQRS